MTIFTTKNLLAAKILAFFTAVMMIMSMLPVQAWAQEVPAAEETPAEDTTDTTEADVQTEESDEDGSDEDLLDAEPQEMSAARFFPIPELPKVKICHATPSETNPFNKVEVSIAAAIAGHILHGDDIFPAFSIYPGQNLNTVYGDVIGQEIYDNNCEMPEPEIPTVSACTVTEEVITTNLSTWDLTQTRASGHNVLVEGGLNIYTDTDVTGFPDPRKAAGYYTTDFMLSELGDQSIADALDYTAASGIEPGLQLAVDFDNNGSFDGYLVGEAVYGNSWWLSNSAAQFVKDDAPNNGGGYGSLWYGTPNEWLTKFPNAKVMAIGYSLGSGVNGNGVINEINLGCTSYTFDLPTPDSLKVYILKYLKVGQMTTQVPNDSTAPAFPMTATWSAENIGSGSGAYVLGNYHGQGALKYAADTSAMDAPADYTTSEVTGGDSIVLAADAQCEPGKYRLVGYKQGDTKEAAESAALSTTAPVYTDITTDKYVIVVNEMCAKPVACAIGQNLIQNGSFETEIVNDNGGTWQIFSTIAGWMHSLSSGLEIWNNFNGTGAGLASDGEQNAELDGDDATRITQPVTLVPGATYELSFDYSPRAQTTLADSKMDALIDGNTVMTLNTDGSANTANAWTSHSVTFVATTTSATVGFEDKGSANDGGGYGPLLDNVALCMVEEPAPLPTCTLTIKSDGTDYVVEKNAAAKVLATPYHPSWITAIGTSTAKWIWGDMLVTNPTTAETQTFKKGFNWTGGVASATLKIASDNKNTITLGSFTGGDVNEDNYTGFKTYNVSSGIVNGVNNLEVAVENFALANGTTETNPAGLMYELTITGTGASCGTIVPEVPKTTGTVTMCKVDANDEPLAGWTMTLLGDTVDSVVVPANNAAGVNTTASLDAGKSYVAVAQGTWDNNRGPLNVVDAEYSTEDNWVTQMDGFTSYPTDILELSINNVLDPQSQWGTYNGDHTYAQMFTQAATGTAKFHIADTFYGDNTGSLNVTVFEGYAGVTGSNGCVTFTNVPFGMYDADEVLKSGWEQVSGAGDVELTHLNTPKTITIVNEMADNDDDDTDPETYTLGGYKYNCSEDDGDYACEVPIAGWTIYASNGSTTLTATTTADGSYSFEVEAGEWIVSESMWGGWEQVMVAKNGEKIDANQCEFEVDSESDSWFEKLRSMVWAPDYKCDFGNYYNPEPENPTYKVSGTKYEVISGQEGLVPKAGWVIYADNTSDDSVAVSTTTDSDGNYSFDLPAGTWQIYEETVTGWTQIAVYENGEEPLTDGEVAYCEFRLGIKEARVIDTENDCDFHNQRTVIEEVPTPIPTPTSNRSGGGGSGTRVTNRATPAGLVLGAASSTPVCGIYLEDYMRAGNAASSTQVVKLQIFLNAVGIKVEITGAFDAATDAAVRAFQVQHKAEVLTPWFMAKIVPHDNPTGWVYQLTRWKINNIVCPGSEAYPVLN